MNAMRSRSFNRGLAKWLRRILAVHGAGLHIVVQLLDVAHAHCARGRRRHLHQAGGTACASCGGLSVDS